jgi:hypothetical protein
MLILIFCFVGIFSNTYSQNVELKNLQLKFIDADTFVGSIIYGFKDANENSFYFISSKYNPEVIMPNTKLELERKYSITAYKLSPPIILKKINQYDRIPVITYFDILTEDNQIGEEVFSINDTVKVDLYYSPNIISWYFLELAE